MCRLKNYTLYLSKIERYAKLCNIKITYCQCDGDGSFSSSRRRIRIDNDLSEAKEVAVLLHELGHALDDSMPTGPKARKTNAAYANMYDKLKVTDIQLSLIIECEQRAWNIGRAIAKKLSIRLGKWYDNHEKECLDNYKNT